jgi:NhaP-type Na+/H+ or K+/H+ antiporter
MIHLIESGYGRKHSIPQLIMAGASADDIYNIVLFTSFMGIYAGQGFSPAAMLEIPVSILTGVAVGIGAGLVLVRIFRQLHIRDTIKVLIILGVSFLMVGLQDLVSQVVPFSGLLAVMTLGGTILKTYEVLARRISGKFSKIWVAAELVLFVLVGAEVDVRYAAGAGLAVVGLILGGCSSGHRHMDQCQWSRTVWQRKTVQRDRLLAQSHRPGCHRRLATGSRCGSR